MQAVSENAWLEQNFFQERKKNGKPLGLLNSSPQVIVLFVALPSET